jgi:plastocyanin
MKHRGMIVVGTLALAMTVAMPVIGRAHDKDKGKDGDKDNAVAVQDATVYFGQHQIQTPDPAPVGAAVTHFLFPEDVTIVRGGTVNFVVNGGGHGIAIHPVSKKTTRSDIAAGLCDGNNNETGAGNEAADRRARAAVCNGTVVTPVVIGGIAVNVTGTNNLDYVITDAKGNVVIDPGFNVTIPTTPPIVLNNPRLDDPTSSARLLATSGASPGDTLNPTLIAANRAGAFLTGTAAPATVGQRIQVQFAKSGRYLVICMNRAHSLNDHMFGFVNVVGDDDDDK